MKVNEFYLAVKIFNQRRAAFHPVAAIQILHPVNRLNLGPVDVATNHAIRLVAARHGGQRSFVFCNEFHGGLGFELQKRRQRPVPKPHRATRPVEIEVKVENPIVKVGSQFFEEMIKVRQAIRLVAVNDEIFFPVGGGVHHLPRHRHCAETHAHELLDELIVVA